MLATIYRLTVAGMLIRQASSSEETIYEPAEASLFAWLNKRCSLTALSTPVVDGSTLNVDISFNLYRFYELSTVQERIALIAELDISWHHPCVNWEDIENNPNVSSGSAQSWSQIDSLIIDSTIPLWTPKLQLINAIQDAFVINRYGSDTPAYTLPNGTFTWEPMGRFDVVCEQDLWNFPFDTQCCEILIEAWEATSHINFTSAQFVIFDRDSFMDRNHLWKLVSYDARLVNMTYNGDSDDYSRAIMSICLQRDPYYYVSTILIPCGALSLLEICTLIITPDTCDRPYFAVSVVLAVAVLTSFMTNLMPITSQMVLLSLNLLCQFLIGVVITIYSMVACTLCSDDRFTKIDHRWNISLIRKLDILVALATALVSVTVNAYVYSKIVK